MRPHLSSAPPFSYSLRLVLLAFFCFGWVNTFAQPVHAEYSNEDCMECHGDTSKPEILVKSGVLSKSVHQDLECIDCHTKITEKEHAKSLPKVDCSSCHEDENAEFKESVHGRSRMKIPRFIPGCTSCHGTHNILKKSNPDSAINPNHLVQTCGECHSHSEVMKLFGRAREDPAIWYKKSIHGKKGADGSPEHRPALCIDCHGSHGIYPPRHPKSKFSKFELPKTCGKCHEKVVGEYMQSIHWKSLNDFGNVEAPVCYNCHGEHGTDLPAARNPGVPKALASSLLCASCHSNSVLMARFGLDAERFSSYMKTYHGLAVLRGSPRAASCTSCHEVHAIRAKNNPDSTVNPKNLPTTCGKCHTSASEDFVQVSVHPLNQKERNPVAYFFKNFYILVIILVVGAMFLHNCLILAYHIWEKWKHDRHQPQVQRFHKFEVWQHMMIFICFTLLTITGFALKFPDSLWVHFLVQMGLDEARRGLIHRVAATLLIIVCLTQLFYLLCYKSGRREVRELVPRWSDVTSLIKNIRFYLWLSKERPKFGRYDYSEKAEYLALVWGTGIMIATGLVLWFPEFFMHYLPSWGFELSEVVHYYEAILAVLAIIVWHLFFVVYHPEKYPMSLSWITGKITLEEQEKHHPLEDLEELDEATKVDRASELEGKKKE